MSSSSVHPTSVRLISFLPFHIPILPPFIHFYFPVFLYFSPSHLPFCVHPFLPFSPLPFLYISLLPLMNDVRDTTNTYTWLSFNICRSRSFEFVYFLLFIPSHRLPFIISAFLPSSLSHSQERAPQRALKSLVPNLSVFDLSLYFCSRSSSS